MKISSLNSRLIDWLDGSDSEAIVESCDMRVAAPADAECMCWRFLTTDRGGRVSPSLADHVLLADCDCAVGGRNWAYWTDVMLS